jgi:hypothetical protein
VLISEWLSQKSIGDPPGAPELLQTAIDSFVVKGTNTYYFKTGKMQKIHLNLYPLQELEILSLQNNTDFGRMTNG